MKVINFVCLCVLCFFLWACENSDFNISVDEVPVPVGTFSAQQLNLRVYPDKGNATLTWNNPDADVRAINITYWLSNGSGEVMQYPLITPATNSAATTRNQANVSIVITGLEDLASYNFMFQLILDAAESEQQEVISTADNRTIGANYDNDELADIVDPDDDGDGVVDLDADGDGLGDNADSDDDGDGVIDTDADGDGLGDNADKDDDNDGTPDTDTDGDKLGNNADPDDDNDGVPDVTDAFPLDNNSYAFVLGNLRVIPGDTNATFTWDNPDADISAINITYISSDVLGVVVYHPLIINGIIDAPATRRNQINASAAITGLMNYESPDFVNYTFMLEAVLTGVDVNKNTIAVIAANISIGPNYDNDELIDVLDPDDDNNGEKDTDADGDGLGDNADLDDDNDGVPDVTDAFPLDNNSYAFVLGNLRVIPGDTNATFTWDNPDADISAINITYISSDILGVSSSVVYPALISNGIGDASITRRNQINASAAITGLMNYESPDFVNYTFMLEAVLTGVDVNKNTIAVIAANISIGPNYDNDELIDVLDPDDDNNGEKDTDADGDGLGDNADLDDDNDGVPDVTDAFPLDNNSYAFVLGNLRVIPGDTNATFTWDNPDADISAINITYVSSDVLGVSSSVVYPALISNGIGDVSITGHNQINASAAITGLMNYESPDFVNYTFTLEAVLTGADVNKNTVAVIAANISIGPNHDNDELIDMLDDDDDNDGTPDTDTDGDKLGNNADPDDDNDGDNDDVDLDDDNDGVPDVTDAYPLDASRVEFTFENVFIVPGDGNARFSGVTRQLM